MISSIQQNASESTIPSATDFPMTRTEASSQLSKINSIISQGTVDESTLDTTFPGFKPLNYQGEIKTTGVFVTDTLSPWQNQDELTFLVRPPMDSQPIPSTAQLIMPIKFTQKDGTAIPKIDFPKTGGNKILSGLPTNNFFGRLFTRIIVKKSNSQISKIQEYTALESSIEMNSIGNNRMNMSNDLLYSKEKNYPGTTRIPSGPITDNDDGRVTPSYKDRIKRTSNKVENIVDAIYNVDLAFLSNFFKINGPLPTNYTFEIEFKFEKDNRVLFETIAPLPSGQTITSYDPFKWTFNKQPYLTMAFVSESSNARSIFSNTLQSTRAYRLSNNIEYNVFNEPMLAGTTEINRTLSHPGYKHEFLIVKLVSTESFRKSTVYTNSLSEDATRRISKIEISGFSHFNQVQVLKFDFSNNDDKRQLYKNYIAFKTGGTFDHNTAWANKNNMSYEWLPSHDEYWDGYGDIFDRYIGGKEIKGKTSGYEIIIDLKASAGFTDKLEPVIQGDDLRARITYEEGGLKEAYSQIILMAYRTQYATVKNEKTSAVSVAYATNSSIN